MAGYNKALIRPWSISLRANFYIKSFFISFSAKESSAEHTFSRFSQKEWKKRNRRKIENNKERKKERNKQTNLSINK